MIQNSGGRAVTPVAKQEAVAHLQACRVIDADRKSVRYCSTRDDDATLRERLRALANQRRRFRGNPRAITIAQWR